MWNVLTMLDFRSKEDLSNDLSSGAGLLIGGAWTTLGEALNHGRSHLGPRRPLYATEELY